MNWLHYLLEANIYLAVFYLLYYILLANETHYRANRTFLLAICILAYIIPFIQVGFLKPTDNAFQATSFVIKRTAKTVVTAETSISWQDALIYGYIIGAGATAAIFVMKIIRLLSLVKAKKSLLENKYSLITIENSNTAFSFFNYVFIGTNVAGAETVIRHELVHIRQKHSADIIFLELIKAVSWFNPFIYLLQRSLKSVHEYIADEQAAGFENDKLAYSSLLVSNAYGLGGSSITHSFFNYNLLKKRIIMLNQKRSGNLARLKYLATLPVCAGLLCVSTLGFSKTYGVIDIAPQKLTDTTKKLKIVEVKQPSETSKKIRKEVDLTLKNEAFKQRQLVIVKKQATAKVQEITIDPVRDTTKKLQIVKQLPGLEIAAAGNATAQGKPVTKIRINGKDIKEVKADVYIDKDQSSVQQQQQRIPPPMEPIPPASKDFDALFKAIGKSVRYPALARERNIVGTVILKFDLNADHKISDIMVMNGIGNGCDEEAVRALKAFNGPLEAKAGNYKIAVTFGLTGVDAPKPASNDYHKDPSFAGEVVIMGMPIKKK